MENPFKFGSLVDAPYFTDRVKELDYIVQFLKSENHLVLMSPRRFGKSSLVKKAVIQTQRPYLWLNMQAVLSKEDFAAKLLKELLNQFKLEKMKHYLRNFRIIPSINMNPMTDELSVSFQPSTDSGTTAIEDVLNTIQKPTKENVVDNHFGHCEYYTILTVGQDNQILSSETIPSPQGCGCKSNIAGELENMGVSVMLAGNMGQGALNVLTTHHIKVIRGCSGNILDVATDYLNGKLTDSGVGCSSHEHHHECHGQQS